MWESNTHREEGKEGGELALDYQANGETVYEEAHSNQNHGPEKAQSWTGSKGHLLESPALIAVPTAALQGQRIQVLPAGYPEPSALEEGPSQVGQPWFVQSSSNPQKKY